MARRGDEHYYWDASCCTNFCTGIPRTPLESPPSQLEHDDSSTTSMTLPSILQQPLPPVLLIPSIPTALQVNSNARHPILDLIACAKEGWNTELARANRTLADA
ncbi:hypothetical protein AZE42_12029, partial [Rhizopogon vesiculosus]